ncbi:MAG: hypothetical protein Fur0010_15730 [Bdellovibrio sp.]
MAEFHREKMDMFLGVVRKYQQLRGYPTQKDLADLTEIGVSTMSRFFNNQIQDLNAHMIAKIVAKLKIPASEYIDFIAESFSDQFLKLVAFYQNEKGQAPVQPPAQNAEEGFDEALAGALSGDESSSAQKTVKGHINIGGRQSSVVFQNEGKSAGQQLMDKLRSLTARQKGFLNDFMNLDMDGRDLVVDIGNNIIRYLRQKGIEF